MFKHETTAPRTNNSSAVQTYLEPQMVRFLTQSFKDEESYIRIMANLWQTREGLCKLTDDVDDINPTLLDMRRSINDIIGCLLPQDMNLLHKIELKANMI